MSLIDLPKDKIDKCFKNIERQAQYWDNLHRLAIPNWDKIKKIEGFPKVSKNTNTYLFDKAIEFDGLHHPSIMAGGLWIDKGFGTDFSLDRDWCVDISSVNIISKK